jgi:hypothetical protein
MFVKSVMIFMFHLLQHFCKRTEYAFANVMSDGFVVLFCYHQQQDTLLQSLRRSVKMPDVIWYKHISYVRIMFIHVRFVK